MFWYFFKTLSEIEKVVLRFRDDVPVTIKNVANITLGPDWDNLSQVKAVEFYNCTGRIYESLCTFDTAQPEEIPVTIFVIIVSV